MENNKQIKNDLISDVYKALLEIDKKYEKKKRYIITKRDYQDAFNFFIDRWYQYEDDNSKSLRDIDYDVLFIDINNIIKNMIKNSVSKKETQDLLNGAVNNEDDLMYLVEYVMDNLEDLYEFDDYENDFNIVKKLVKRYVTKYYKK